MNKTEDFFFPENFFGFCLLFRTFVPDSSFYNKNSIEGVRENEKNFIN